MASVPQPKNVASLTFGALALSAVYVVGQRVLRHRVEHRYEQEMEELVHRIAAIQHLRYSGGEAGKVADIIDRLEHMGIMIPAENVDPDEEAEEGITFVPDTGDIHLTFPERLTMLLRPRMNDRTSYKMLIALEQIMKELSEACDMAGVNLGLETERKGKQGRND